VHNTNEDLIKELEAVNAELEKNGIQTGPTSPNTLDIIAMLKKHELTKKQKARKARLKKFIHAF
jgi:hypothetical protein